MPFLPASTPVIPTEVELISMEQIMKRSESLHASEIRPSLFRQEAQALVKNMTLTEKAGLCSGSGFWTLEEISRLGLDKITVSDGPHGLRKDNGASHMGLSDSVPATCFPTAVGLGASWDRRLLERVGQALGKECVEQDVAVLLGPGINIKRHPLCGRNFEYFSEDPMLTGELAAAFIDGVQQHGVGTSLKHYAANQQENSRLTVDTLVDERTLREIYLPAFEAAVKKAQPWTIMCAYNRLNGFHCSEHNWLLNQVLRDEWLFEGSVITDWGAVVDRVAGVASGCDIEMPASGGGNDARVVAAVRAGKLRIEQLDTVAVRVTELILAGMARRALRAKELAANVTKASAQGPDQPIREPTAVAASGEEDESRSACFPSLPAATMNVRYLSTENTAMLERHDEFARECAAQSAVLLKNEGGLLPLKTTARLALIGGFAEHPRYQGSGSSKVNAYRVVTPLAAIRTLLGANGTLSYAAGYDPVAAEPDKELITEAVAAARGSDVAVILAGLPGPYESEGFDRDHMCLPPQMNDLVGAVAAVQSNVVVVLSNGAPVEMPWVDEIPAIMECYLGGQGGAVALADLLFGKACPCGKLAETFPVRASDCPSDREWALHPRQVVYREGLNVGYRYFATAKEGVLFPFGHGLSYTSFDYSALKLGATRIDPEGSLSVSLVVRNTGKVAGAEVVQVYVRDCEASVYRPDRELRGFEKVWLKAGEKVTVNVTLPPRAFAFYDVNRREWFVEPGDFEILIGASVADIRLTGRVAVQAKHPRIAPTEAVPAAVRSYVTLADHELAQLGLNVPVPDPLRPFNMRTTVGDIADYAGYVGSSFFWMLKKAMGTVEDPMEEKVRVEVVRSLPLQQFANFANGNAGRVVMPDSVLRLMLCCFRCSPGQREEPNRTHAARSAAPRFVSTNSEVSSSP